MDDNQLQLEAEDIIKDVSGLVESISICATIQTKPASGASKNISQNQNVVENTNDIDSHDSEEHDFLWLNISCLEPEKKFTVKLSADGLLVSGSYFSFFFFFFQT